MHIGKGTGLIFVSEVEGGHTIEEVQKALGQKLRIINTKDFPSLEKLFYKEGAPNDMEPNNSILSK